MKIPDQIKRLSVPFALLIVALVGMRYLLVPKSFGKYGHYRADAVDGIAGNEIRYAGHEACAVCHTDVTQTKSNGYHRSVSCEVCHGPAQAHIDDPTGVKPPAPRERGYCPLCHGYLASRPTGFPQIIPATHNPVKPCYTCHNPHDPKPPHVPEECSACHAGIARTKAVSSHSELPCIRCHDTPKKHMTEPRNFRPKKPMNREFCGGCHAVGASSPAHIPRVDPAGHYTKYLCWQCHYPHLPEAR